MKNIKDMRITFFKVKSNKELIHNILNYFIKIKQMATQLKNFKKSVMEK